MNISINKGILLCICAAVCTFSSCSKEQEQKKKEDEKATSVTMKVMSFNIRHTGEASDTGDKAWDKRKEAVLNMLRDKDPDIIGVQECTTTQIQYLNANLTDYTPFQPGYNKFSMFKKSKFTQEGQGLFFHSETPDVAGSKWSQADGVRVTSWLKLKEKTTGRSFYFFNTHLDATYASARKKSAELNVLRMQEVCGEKAPQIIVGDMNTDLEECLGFYKSWMTSSREASVADNNPTYQGFGTYTLATAKYIDYIYARNLKLKVHETVISGDYGVKYVSDHWPIMLTCEMTSK